NVCALSTGNVYTATAGLTYNWSITGNGAIPGATNAQSVAVNAGASGSFTLSLTLIDGDCSNSCSRVVNVAYATAITAQPVSVPVCFGSTTNFTVSATGTSL